MYAFVSCKRFLPPYLLPIYSPPPKQTYHFKALDTLNACRLVLWRFMGTAELYSSSKGITDQTRATLAQDHPSLLVVSAVAIAQFIAYCFSHHFYVRGSFSGDSVAWSHSSQHTLQQNIDIRVRFAPLKPTTVHTRIYCK
jgi:hypothetical protein